MQLSAAQQKLFDDHIGLAIGMAVNSAKFYNLPDVTELKSDCLNALHYAVVHFKNLKKDDGRPMELSYLVVNAIKRWVIPAALKRARRASRFISFHDHLRGNGESATVGELIEAQLSSPGSEIAGMHELRIRWELERAIQKLPHQQRRFFENIFIKGVSIKQATCHLTRRRLDIVWHEGLESLRKHFRDLGYRVTSVTPVLRDGYQERRLPPQWTNSARQNSQHTRWHVARGRKNPNCPLCQSAG